MTYASPLYINITKKVSRAVEQDIPLKELDDDQREELKRTGEMPTKLVWELEESAEDDDTGKSEDWKNMVFVGKLPIMVKSKFCHLSREQDDSLVHGQ